MTYITMIGGSNVRGFLGTRPLCPISFIFLQFSAKFCEIIGWRTSLGSWRPPLGNPGSVTVHCNSGADITKIHYMGRHGEANGVENLLLLLARLDSA